MVKNNKLATRFDLDSQIRGKRLNVASGLDFILISLLR